MILSPQKTFDQEINYSCQEHYDGQSVHTMHHLNVNVCWPVWIFLSKKIISKFPQGEKILECHLLFLLRLILHKI